MGVGCFKKGRPCESGRAVLEQQMVEFNNPEFRDVNPFTVSDDDIALANPEMLIIDEDIDGEIGGEGF